MKIKIILFALAISSLSLFSCKREYKKTDNGALMKFYTINKDNPKPEIGDLVLVDVIQKISDSVLFTSIPSSSIFTREPVSILLKIAFKLSFSTVAFALSDSKVCSD